MSYLNPNHFLMNLETKLKKMIDYLNIALQCKNDEEKIQFYADYPAAFFLGESDEIAASPIGLNVNSPIV